MPDRYRQLVEIFLQRTAGTYIRVKSHIEEGPLLAQSGPWSI
jgi:hypothetical protein